MSTASDPWAWFLSKSGTAREAGRAAGTARIFCFPHAGGSPRAFLDWQADLGADAEILAICRPGREHRAAEPAPTIGELIDGAAAAIAAIASDDRPYYLLGHSLGALIAFEVCRKLAGAGQTSRGDHGGLPPVLALPRHLIASGCSAPSLLPSQRVRQIATLTGQEFAEAIGFFGGLPADAIADESVRDLLLPGIIADFRMAIGYRYLPAPRLAVPATIVVGKDDPHVKLAQVEPWDAEFTWPPDRHWVDGGHFYFEQRADAITGILRSVVQADQHVELI